MHLALDHVEGVAGEPETFARQAAVEGDAPLTDVFSSLWRGGGGVGIGIAAGDVLVHHPFESAEPGAVRGRFPQHRHHLAPIQVPGRARARLLGDFSDAVHGPGVEPLVRAVRLRLQSDPNVLDRARDDRVCDPRKGPRGVVLCVRE